MPLDGCPTEHELLERAGDISGKPRAAGEADGFEEHVAACSECRIIVSALERASRPDPRSEEPCSEEPRSEGAVGAPRGTQRCDEAPASAVEQGDSRPGHDHVAEALARREGGLILGMAEGTRSARTRRALVIGASAVLAFIVGSAVLAAGRHAPRPSPVSAEPASRAP
jgi:hypothetical protein